VPDRFAQSVRLLNCFDHCASDTVSENDSPCWLVKKLEDFFSPFDIFVLSFCTFVSTAVKVKKWASVVKVIGKQADIDRAG